MKNSKKENETSLVNCREGPVTRVKDIYKGGFFYIEDCFYNDTRYPEALDYSKTIIEWASNSKRGVGPFKTAKMEETLIEDLKIRIGYPYVYVHQGIVTG